YTLTLSNTGVSDAVAEKFPHLATLPALTLPAGADPAMLLKGQLAVSAVDSEGTLLDATGLQIPGVLDDLYTFTGDLGVTWAAGVPSIALWAPTAQSVILHIFNTSTISTSTPYTMTWDGATGVWAKTGMADWTDKYYLFEVHVYAPSTQKIEQNLVTDPYAVSLSTNSARSQIVDLTATALKPAGWDALAKPAVAAPEDISIYEIHVRDFSVNDPTVPDNLKGTFKAFTLPESNGVKHLKVLEAAGLSHLHLLPIFDLATIDENKANWQTPDFTDADMGPASEDQQTAVVAVENTDAFNWGYDPFHYGVPEGSYSTNPDGTARIVEFREMVEALNKMGLRVVVDVVYNHTNAAGQAEKSVLDKIVPGYYQRLNASGQVESSTCCANTATEHNMMEKLMVDTLVLWAKEYKVDSFRFDLMGHHMVRNMVAVRTALDALTVAEDGVDGKSIYLYGEGWNFGEVADNARGVNATQLNLGGLGIGSFSDRLRDAVRGPSPFASGEDLKTQGFANGLSYDPNALAQGGAEAQKTRLLLLTDQIKVGMAGNLADYEFVDRTGTTVKGSQVDYNGQPAGYTQDPQEVITYIDKHDNQTLYDINAYAAPTATSMADRVRIQTVGQAIVLLGQGVPFVQAGSDILRSKSLDRDSYNSGDWFNKLDFTYASNNFGVGLPVASKNQDNWPVMTPFLTNPALVPAQAEIEQAGTLFRELLQIRYSSPLFRLQTEQAIMDHVRFYNSGPDQLPGLIVMAMNDDAMLTDMDPNYEGVVVLINANDEAQTFANSAFAGRSFGLHPVQAAGVDAVVKTSTFTEATGSFTVPGRTAAVFVEADPGLNYKILLMPIYKNAMPMTAPAPDPLDVALAQPAITVAGQKEIVYFVMTDRFANGNTANDYGGLGGGESVTDTLRHGYLPTNSGYFHGGDMAGLTAKLDYLANMGVTAIWMTPPFGNDVTQGNGTVAGSSAGYHGYWGTDFLNIDPHLGDRAAFTTLVDDAHDKGIKVYLDIVVNHTGDVISYDGGVYDYVTKASKPYKDAGGTAFDDRDYAGGATFPTLSAATSFPYSPTFATPDLATIKNPAWLNDPTVYHNRGDSTFAGESSNYGDFFGLDDLFTEQPVVLSGLTDLYKSWITDFGIDGYRLDTVKHVNTEFWQSFAPAILDHAKAQGKPDFTLFGEVFNGDPAYLSTFTSEAKLPSVLDFGFQGAATNFAVNGTATDNLRDFFAKDDYYTDADSNAYGLATFLSNHDNGRIGYGLTGLNVTDAEMLARDKLAQGLMVFSRGFPIVYYGDEQGFVGGGDKDGREDMFPSQVASYNDNDLIGTSATTAADNFDPTHPLYTALADFAALRKAHPALSNGAQIHRTSSAGAGVYAFSRIDRAEQIEYVLLFNNSKAPKRVSFPVFQANTAYSRIYPAGGPAVNTDGHATFTVDVPALSFAIYRQGAVPNAPAPDKMMGLPVTPTFTLPASGGTVGGRAEIAVTLSRPTFAEVTFAVSVNGGDYVVIGTDTNPPYRVFWNMGELAKDTPLTFRAIVRDLFEGTLTSATVNAMAGAPAGSDAGYAILHYNRPAGDYAGWGLHLWGDAIDPTETTQWTSPKLPTGEDAYGMFWAVKLADAAKPVNFIIHKGDEKDGDGDRTLTPADSRQIWLKQGDTANHPNQAAAQGFATVHYQRADADYTDWGLHLWQETGDLTAWASPLMHTMTDTFGVTFVISKTAYPSLDFTKPLNFIIHKGDEKDTNADRSFTPSATPSVWLKSGEASVFKHLGAAENFVVIHYHRAAGDYAGWGLHMWTGYDSATGGAVEWATPFLPTGEDTFGKVYQVPVVISAGGLAYIMHSGDTKDLPSDQYLDFAQDGFEVWLLQSTPGYLLPMK
ncbi:MAG: pullulanase-type alpha-1,6-glucosidase, partial [Caldilineaceae bacterium]|nr:pullulanase-type alpha-1,6-glucosidase [Caldilineaceae bacterium]MBP8121119.1 pullulanase-type alpha-1,6-glucosidase [Caldilineaceae bacterium]